MDYVGGLWPCSANCNMSGWIEVVFILALFYLSVYESGLHANVCAEVLVRCTTMSSITLYKYL